MDVVDAGAVRVRDAVGRDLVAVLREVRDPIVQVIVDDRLEVGVGAVPCLRVSGASPPEP